jgi:hypothetical protein
MEWELLCAGISLLVLGILTIAGSSIATECYNENKAYSEKKTSNYNFLIINLVSAILVVLISFVSIYFAFTKKPMIIRQVATSAIQAGQAAATSAIAPPAYRQIAGSWRMKRK